jgi:hypothetical protein
MSVLKENEVSPENFEHLPFIDILFSTKPTSDQ